jgi:hypothetical protein
MRSTMSRLSKGGSRWLPILHCAAILLATQSVLLATTQGQLALKINLALQTIVLFLMALWSSRASGTYVNAPLVFASCLYLWHSTFLVGHYFQLAPIFEFSGTAFTYGFEYIFKATALVGLSLALTIIGVIHGYNRQLRTLFSTRDKAPIFRSLYGSLSQSSNRVAWLLASILLLVLLNFLIREGSETFQGDYMDIYYRGTSSLSELLFYRSQFLWVFVIILLVACNRDRRKKLLLITMGVLIFAVIMAMLGTRSVPFIFLATFLIAYDCFVKRVKIWMLAAFLILLSAASYVIDNSRGTGLGTHVFQFSDSGKEQVELLHFFYQNGLIIRSVLRTMDFGQEKGLAYGRSFLDATISVIPSPVLHLVGYEPAVLPSAWLAESSPDVGPFNGIGYSLVAEMYYNFGMPGCLGFFAIGWYIGSTYFRYVFRGDIFAALNVLTVVAMYTLHMRSDAPTYLRLLIYGFIIVAYLKRERVASFLKSRRQENVAV